MNLLWVPFVLLCGGARLVGGAFPFGHDGVKIFGIFWVARTRRVLDGMSEAEKQAFVFAANFNRRNLSPSQKQDAGKKMKSIAKALKTEGHTQQEVARKLGQPRERVRNWLMRNGQKAKTHKHDSRVKIPVLANPAILNRVEGGEKQEQVAADYGVAQSPISRIVTKEKKQRQAKKEREKAVAVAERLRGIVEANRRQEQAGRESGREGK